VTRLNTKLRAEGRGAGRCVHACEKGGEEGGEEHAHESEESVKGGEVEEAHPWSNRRRHTHIELNAKKVTDEKARAISAN